MTTKKTKPAFYRLELNKTAWDIPAKYTKLQLIGSGAYGQVCSAYDEENGQKVAIKKLSRPFQSAIHSKRTYREIRMLKHMKHDDIIGLLDIFTPANTLEEFHDLYLVTDLMGPDLGKVVKNQDLSASQIQLYVYQVLRGLKYIHSAGIIHRDLKPSNLAVDINGELKILDFGLARYKDYKTEELTGYVITRWYRAPEIMLNWMHYNRTVDVWSVGCIMAELFSGRPLFPGKDSIDQLKKTMSVLGTPNDALLKKLTSDDARNYIRSMPHMSKQDLRRFDQNFKKASDEAIDLIEKMLDMDPDTRISAEEALAHPYLRKYGDPTDEPVSEPYDPSFENDTLTVEGWKKLSYEEVVTFEPKKH